jgi:hypothetical protein
MADYQAFYEKHLGKIKWGKGGEGLAPCPFHDDRKPSLSVNRDSGPWHCFAGCGGGTAQDFARRLGVDPPDRRKQDPMAAYDYQDRESKIVYQVVRYHPKKFLQRRPDGKGGWAWDLKGITQVPYNLPEVLKAEGFVFIVEGEKDVETLRALGLTATTNSGGAGKWRDEFSQYLEGMNVIILPDNDAPGREHARKVHASLYGKANGVLIADLPGLGEKEDVTDWLEKGHTVDELRALVAKEWDKAAAEEKLRPPTVTTAPNVEAQIEDEASQEDLSIPPFPRELLVWPYDKLMGIIEPTTDCVPEALFLGMHIGLGVAVGRKVKMVVSTDIWPIEWALMVGPSFISRKSIPINLAKKIARGIDTGTKLMSGLGSIEKVCEVLSAAKAVRLLIGTTEFGGTLAVASRPGTSNLVQELCDLYDHPEIFSLGTKASEDAEHYVCGIITGTTREGMEPFLRQHHITGGLFGRFLPLLIRPGEGKSYPPPLQENQFQGVLDEIQEKLEGSKSYGKLISLDSRAKTFWDEWWRTWWKDLNSKPEAVLAFVGRIETHIRKAALIRAALESSNSITLEQIEWAIKLGMYLQRHSEALLKDIGLSAGRRLEERAMAILRKHHPLRTRDIQMRLNDAPSAKVLRSYLEGMALAGMIVRLERPDKQGRPVEWWSLP